MRHCIEITDIARGRTGSIVLALAIMFFGCAELPDGESATQLGEKAATSDGQSFGSTFDEDTCSYDISDPYEPRSRFEWGPFEGDCHDTFKRRPIVRLSGDEAKAFQDSAGHFVVANVYHDGAFWIAYVPRDAVQDVFFQLEYFPAIVPAGHTQLRVDFNQPVSMYGQSDSNRGQFHETKYFVLSAEAVTRRGDKYDLFRGVQDHFAIALRVTTLEARYRSMVEDQGHRVEQWRLQLDEWQRHQVFAWYIGVSREMRLEHPYHTVSRNCTTEVVDLLDSIVNYTLRERIGRFLLKVTEFYPNVVRAALIARGLLPLDQSTDWYELKDDPVISELLSQSH